MHDIALAFLIFLPLVITFFLKSNAGLGFLTLCLGFVLTTSVIGDLKHLLSEKNLTVTNETLAIALVLVPFLLTLALTRKSAGKDFILGLQLVVALFAGGLLALTIGPLLSSAGQFDITSSAMWPNLVKSQAVIIGVGSFLSLFLVWFFSGSRKHSRKH